jgi:hypothetical protein
MFQVTLGMFSPSPTFYMGSSIPDCNRDKSYNLHHPQNRHRSFYSPFKFWIANFSASIRDCSAARDIANSLGLIFLFLLYAAITCFRSETKPSSSLIACLLSMFYFSLSSGLQTSVLRFAKFPHILYFSFLAFSSDLLAFLASTSSCCILASRS